MTISNFKDKYLKLSTSILDKLTENPAGYESIEVSGKLGCDGTTYTETLEVANLLEAGWKVDLSIPVQLGNTVFQVKLKNLWTLEEFNFITTGIAFSYIANNCTNPSGNCTIEDFSSYFVAQFEGELNAFLESIGQLPTGVVTFTGNVMHITGLPTYLGMAVVEYGEEYFDEYNVLPFGYGTVDSNVTIDESGIFIAAAFFEEGATTLTDGIYTVTVKVTKAEDGGFTTETSCAFIDVLTKCKLSETLNAYIGTDAGKSEEALAMTMLHYALVNGSNCGCNCADLCAAYDKLVEMLGTLEETTIVEDCGC